MVGQSAGGTDSFRNRSSKIRIETLHHQDYFLCLKKVLEIGPVK